MTIFINAIFYSLLRKRRATQEALADLLLAATSDKNDNTTFELLTRTLSSIEAHIVDINALIGSENNLPKTLFPG